MRRLTSRQRLAAASLTVIAAGFIALDLTGGSLSQAHSGSRGVLGALYRGSDSVLGPVRRYTQALPDAAGNSARISALEAENAQLKNQVATNAADAATTAQLAQLRLAAGTAGLTIVPGRVIAFGPGQGFDWTATIDIGRSSGVAVDQTVTSGAGLVGRVVQADASTAVVLLAVDPGSGVGVRDVRSGELALATGAGAAGFTVTPLAPTADLKAGDQLETGPAGSSTFVAGLSAGTISAVRVSNDATITATAKSVITPTTLNLVGVIISAGSSAAARAPVTGTGR
jgi:rod shape-determining protein MreC